MITYIDGDTHMFLFSIFHANTFNNSKTGILGKWI